MSDFEDGSIEALAAAISEREAAGHDPDAGRLEALDKPQAAKSQPQEIQPQAAAEESASVEEPVVESAQAASTETVTTPDPEAPKPLLATPDPVAPKQDAQPSTAPEVNPALNQTLERVGTLVQQLEAAANSKFADIKTEADVLQLMQADPARYNEFVIMQRQYQQAVFARSQVQQEAQKAYLTAEQQRLTKEIPELSDPVKGEALKAELRAYAKSQGIPDNRQARSADDVILLHRAMVLSKENATLKAEKASQAAALAKASEKAAVAPPVQKPGATRSEPVNTKLQELEDRFQKTGRPEDLALVYAARGG